MYATNTSCCFAISDLNEVKGKVLNWANRFSTFSFLDNHAYKMDHHSIECILAAGVRRDFTALAGNALAGLHKFLQVEKSWLFGHLGYDLKNEMEDLKSVLPDHIGFPDLYFFEPEIVIQLKENEIQIEGAADPQEVFDEILTTPVEKPVLLRKEPEIKYRITEQEYIQIIHQLQQHILRGDCYEINFCQEFFSENAIIEPIEVYKNICKISPNPFSALYKLNGKFLICASPERYLKKEGSKILSQPIKGTSSRYPGDNQKDSLSKEALHASEKDRSENVMVVDLVRNDLSKVCKEGTVKVDELYGIYSFPQVHQMISTISGDLKDNILFTDIVRATFPMGSMTGAPKKRAMELIEQYEKTKRGIFSGALGYMNPQGDFDFNVVIRSILYNSEKKYLSFPAGSGITFYSDAEKEYKECLLKAEAMKAAIIN